MNRGKPARPADTPRRDHVMTEEEWREMGGYPAPEGYDPDASAVVETEGFTSKGGKLIGGRMETVIHKRRHNPTGAFEFEWDAKTSTYPSQQAALEALAAAHHVRPLTIHWPSGFYPEFTAKDDETGGCTCLSS